MVFVASAHSAASEKKVRVFSNADRVRPVVHVLEAG